ncbi:hypothetical protein DRJ17_01170 [Candidatus Woesearchaeota archaeon]|nr:MAG: hypothetical protein DRJ17_01170 [Candidatus Woesearchaeota archaeon]
MGAALDQINLLILGLGFTGDKLLTDTINNDRVKKIYAVRRSHSILNSQKEAYERRIERAKEKDPEKDVQFIPFCELSPDLIDNCDVVVNAIKQHKPEQEATVQGSRFLIHQHNLSGIIEFAKLLAKTRKKATVFMSSNLPEENAIITKYIAGYPDELLVSPILDSDRFYKSLRYWLGPNGVNHQEKILTAVRKIKKDKGHDLYQYVKDQSDEELSIENTLVSGVHHQPVYLFSQIKINGIPFPFLKEYNILIDEEMTPLVRGILHNAPEKGFDQSYIGSYSGIEQNPSFIYDLLIDLLDNKTANVGCFSPSFGELTADIGYCIGTKGKFQDGKFYPVPLEELNPTGDERLDLTEEETEMIEQAKDLSKESFKELYNRAPNITSVIKSYSDRPIDTSYSLLSKKEILEELSFIKNLVKNN